MFIINGSPHVSDDDTAISLQIAAVDGKIDVIDGEIEILDEHNHSAQKVYPTLANGITVTAAAGVWELGAFVEVVPANTITAPFDIHFLNLGAVSSDTTYEIVFYKGALNAEVEIGRARFARLSAATANISSQPLMTEVLPANTRISAKLATLNGGSRTAVISLSYHTY